MRNVLILFSSLVFAASQANATSSASLVVSSCTGTETVSLLDSASFACTGDYSFASGLIESDVGISINATGGLSITDTVLRAPNIALNAGIVSINAGSVIDAASQGIVIGATNSLFGNPVPLTGPIGGSSGVLTVGVSGVAPGASGNLSISSTGGSIGVTTLTPLVTGGSITLSSGDIQLAANPGALTLQAVILPAVPEPSTYLSMLAGLALLAGVASRRRATT